MDRGDVEFEGGRQSFEGHGVVDAGESEQVRAQSLLLNLPGDHREDVRALNG